MSIPESNASAEQQNRSGHAVVPAALDEAIAAGDAMAETPHDVPRPIGPERLRRLREAIENGRYPAEQDVAHGLEQLFRRP